MSFILWDKSIHIQVNKLEIFITDKREIRFVFTDVIASERNISVKVAIQVPETGGRVELAVEYKGRNHNHL